MKRKDVMQMVATIVAGILSNPACGISASDYYLRQQLIWQTTQDVVNSVAQLGIVITEE